MGNNKIFLSYSRKDSDVAKKLVNDIMSRGGNIWMDQLHIKSGMRWDRAIENALDESSHLMVLLTSSSVTSDDVMDEVSYALDENKIIITAVLDNCKIPFRLRRFQHIDFINNYENGLLEILSTINISVAGNKPPTRKNKPTVEIKPEIQKKKQATDTNTQCPHCKEEVFANDKSFVECSECKNLFFEDDRDGEIYKLVKIGKQIWMGENFRYKEDEGSLCSDNKKENCKKYGRLYNWDTAMKVSPKGWHLSSDKDWKELIAHCGDEDTAGNILKSKSGWKPNESYHDCSANGTNKLNFSALPGGAFLPDGRFWRLGESAYFWTSSSGNNNYYAILRIMSNSDEKVSSNSAKKEEMCSARYLKD